ncbi:SDR family NAD(P)-dependent oxidoreductase [Mycolicibacterium sp.]|uniref:SDR family NAD(P)-dependent oxidoreductase n=1 Tax=Mycolicibacterium sp. TaxID=2320850 RepID=UPI003D0AC942
MGRLDGKVAVVTGAARGIGLATVRRFVEEGATVYASDIAAAQEIFDKSRHHHGIVDATDETAVGDFYADVLAREGRLDVLFSNVGIHLSKALPETTVGEFDRIFDVNVKSAFLSIRAALPAMLDRRSGSVIVTSSNGGLMGRPNDPVYNATKHALVGLVKSLAVRYASHGIRFNSVNPGAIDTDMLRGSVGGTEEIAEKRAVASTPATRTATATEVANAVVFLASDETPFINGVALAVDGAKSAGALSADRYSLDFTLSESQWGNPTAALTV